MGIIIRRFIFILIIGVFQFLVTLDRILYDNIYVVTLGYIAIFDFRICYARIFVINNVGRGLWK